MFKKKDKTPKSPYPKQEYVAVPGQPSGFHQQPGTYPMDPNSYPQPVAPYPYAPGTMVTQQQSTQVYGQPAPCFQPSAPPKDGYGEPPPPYSPYPQQNHYPQQNPYPQYPNYLQQQGYHQASYPTQAPYPTQPMPQTVIVPGGFDACARFNAGASLSIPPPPPGVAPNAAQMAASQGHNVFATQKSSNWVTGGQGGGPIF
ncbi:DAZ-associated protein 2-like [Patella vulgata]|uniref:DAZ-associated protein 2-like n=1 Tax=Patella vulgata TaxID=6465 RepID=UPI0024A7DAA3|nr:DAZ-associated protein 2-like [Patella vulgata]